MSGNLSHKNSPSRDAVDKLEPKQLSHADETRIVAMNEAKSEKCENVREEEMEGEVRVGVVEKVHPISARSSG